MTTVRMDATMNFTLRMPVSQRVKLDNIAKYENRKLTNLINTILQNYIEEWEQEHKRKK